MLLYSRWSNSTEILHIPLFGLQQCLKMWGFFSWECSNTFQKGTKAFSVFTYLYKDKGRIQVTRSRFISFCICVFASHTLSSDCKGVSLGLNMRKFIYISWSILRKEHLKQQIKKNWQGSKSVNDPWPKCIHVCLKCKCASMNVCTYIIHEHWWMWLHTCHVCAHNLSSMCV